MGLVGPKARLKGVTDGQQVNIPVLQVDRPRVDVDILFGLYSSLLEHVEGEGYFQPRSGVTEKEDRSVRID